MIYFSLLHYVEKKDTEIDQGELDDDEEAILNDFLNDFLEVCLNDYFSRGYDL